MARIPNSRYECLLPVHVLKLTEALGARKSSAGCRGVEMKGTPDALEREALPAVWRTKDMLRKLSDG